MIFVTVGEQLPFDRLIRTVDKWAAVSGKEVFAQIGATHLKPQHIKFKKHLELSEFKDIFISAEIIIAHAGMGTIISALEMEKPIIIMPRQARLGEHRNDHQFATAKKFMKFNGISVTFNETELIAKLNCLKELHRFSSLAQESEGYSTLIRTIKHFIS